MAGFKVQLLCLILVAASIACLILLAVLTHGTGWPQFYTLQRREPGTMIQYSPEESSL